MKPLTRKERIARSAHDSPGLRCLDVIEERERIIRSWEPYERRLSPEERLAVSQGDYGAILRPIEPQWVVGQFIKAASNLEIKVTGIEQDIRGGYRTRFDVRDFRARIPRRVPGVFDLPELDEHGFPIEPTKDAIEQARQEGNYTSSAALGVPDCAEEPSEAFLQRDRLEREVNMRDAFKQGIDRRRLDLIRYERQLIKAKQRHDKTGKGGARVKCLETRIRRAQSTLTKAA